MATTAEGRTPTHLWIVGILALLWNAFGCYDYLMTMRADQAYLAQFPADQLAYWDSLPTWLSAFWALGVWGGLVGAVLLLMRSRYAVWAFALSLLGIVISFGYQYLATQMPASMKEGMMAMMPLLIFVIGVFQLWYSRDAEKKGILR
jgi:membrane protein insertase Oxa1/YidC/SpoIIIJ